MIPYRFEKWFLFKKISSIHKSLGLSGKNQVYFSGTRAEKVVKIADLNCDAFIDDLEEVFAEKHFPPI